MTYFYKIVFDNGVFFTIIKELKENQLVFSITLRNEINKK